MIGRVLVRSIEFASCMDTPSFWSIKLQTAALIETMLRCELVSVSAVLRVTGASEMLVGNRELRRKRRWFTNQNSFAFQPSEISPSTFRRRLDAVSKSSDKIQIVSFLTRTSTFSCVVFSRAMSTLMLPSFTEDDLQ